MKTVLVCVWLVNSLIHIISGCSLSAPKEVTGYTGGSVVLPCYCTDERAKPESAKWFFIQDSTFIMLELGPREVDDRYRDRVQHSDTPGNLSLILSRLTVSDEGTYMCEGDGQHKDIKLSVKGVVKDLPTTQNPATTKETVAHGSTKTTGMEDVSEGQAREFCLASCDNCL
ncbi:hypothetical protein SKAU_G00414250 [Synaphobranchus kaupii]|uniref:Ig-like domain-containing protein n=1 Tax=Synaphobranchus kaupii TaxID=118154 RepID=A0A9Q1E718_SYNKA|nr:hypothetical protein SKAU_G00414250 [Synaphobranchus kaupii]